MSIETFPLGPLETNSYLVAGKGVAVAIDAGGEPSSMLASVKKQGLKLTHILLTHLHFDHTLGVAALREGCMKLGHEPEVLCHDGDAFMLRDEFGRGGIQGMPEAPAFPYKPVSPGDAIFAGLACTVLYTPGHTPGGVSYYFPALGAVFAGDALFYRSIGRTDFPRGDTQLLFNSIRTQIYTLPEKTIVYPGHGQETTAGDEKRFNPFVSGTNS